MRESIEVAFPQVVTGSCMETETTYIFHVFDSSTEPKRCYIRRKDEEPLHFTVRNPLNKDVHFLAIDKCVLQDSDVTHCDCAIFSREQFSFVEISDTKKLHRNEKRKKARIQLSQTIEYFRAKGVNFPDDLSAIISFVGKDIYPARNSANNEARLSFFDDYRAVLLEGNQLEF